MMHEKASFLFCCFSRVELLCTFQHILKMLQYAMPENILKIFLQKVQIPNISSFFQPGTINVLLWDDTSQSLGQY